MGTCRFHSKVSVPNWVSYRRIKGAKCAADNISSMCGEDDCCPYRFACDLIWHAGNLIVVECRGEAGRASPPPVSESGRQQQCHGSDAAAPGPACSGTRQAHQRRGRRMLRVSGAVRCDLPRRQGRGRRGGVPCRLGASADCITQWRRGDHRLTGMTGLGVLTL